MVNDAKNLLKGNSGKQQAVPGAPKETTPDKTRGQRMTELLENLEKVLANKK